MAKDYSATVRNVVLRQRVDGCASENDIKYKGSTQHRHDFRGFYGEQGYLEIKSIYGRSGPG